MSECSAGCPTQDHTSWGACIRAKSVGTKAGETTRASFPPPPKETSA